MSDTAVIKERSPCGASTSLRLERAKNSRLASTCAAYKHSEIARATAFEKLATAPERARWLWTRTDSSFFSAANSISWRAPY